MVRLNCPPAGSATQWDAAGFLAIIAYPEPGAQALAERGRFAVGLMAMLAKEAIEQSTIARAAVPRELREYPFAHIYRSGPALKGIRRLTKRLDAWHIAMEIINGTASTVEEAAATVLEARGAIATKSAVKNILSRAWTPSKPVLHLVAALEHQLAINPQYLFPPDTTETKPGAIDFLHLVAEPTWVYPSIRNSHWWLDRMAASPRLHRSLR